MKILFFAGARDVVGYDDLVADLPPTTARGLLEYLCGEFPALAPYAPSLRVAVNGTYASWDDPIANDDEVAIIPPVAGG